METKYGDEGMGCQTINGTVSIFRESFLITQGICQNLSMDLSKYTETEALIDLKKAEEPRIKKAPLQAS